MDDPGSTQFILLAILLMVSGFFSASETALTSLGKIKLRDMLERGVKGAKDVEKLTEDTSKLLSAVLIGNNFANVALSAIATTIALKIAQDNSLVLGITTVIVTLAILIFSEITPKTLAVNNAEQIACFVAKPMRLMTFLLAPISYALSAVITFLLRPFKIKDIGETPTITETEIKTMVTMGHEEGLLKKDERLMINNVFDFNDSRASDIMIPRTDMVAASVTASFNEIIDVFHKERFSRLIIYKDDLDHIVGILHLKDIVFLNETEVSSFEVSKYMRSPHFSYESKPTSELFSEMRTESIPMTVILDEYGGTCGIITIEDLVEEIVGEIYDEYDDEKDYEHINENEFTIGGGVHINDFNELANTVFESDDYDSIGGFVTGIIGKIPQEGDSIIYENVTFTIEELGKNRIERLHVKVQ